MKIIRTRTINADLHRIGATQTDFEGLAEEMPRTTALGESEQDTDFGASLIEGLKEALAWKRSEITLPVTEIPSLTPGRVKAIRKSVAKSPREFARRFGIPARTLEGWEQGRRSPDVTASVLLRVIERNPGAVEEVVARRGAAI